MQVKPINILTDSDYRVLPIIAFSASKTQKITIDSGATANIDVSKSYYFKVFANTTFTIQLNGDGNELPISELGIGADVETITIKNTGSNSAEFIILQA